MIGTVLLIGANGFLANHVIELLHKDHIVDGVYNSKKDKIVPHYYRNIFSYDELDSISNKYDVVLILAARIPYENMNKIDQGLIESNILLVDFVTRKFKNSRVVFASSVSVYGQFTKVRDESSSCVNPNSYGLSKLLGEGMVSTLDSFCILRFSSIYGLGMIGHSFLPAIVKQAKSSQSIMIYGDGARKQNYIHVKDAAAFVLQAIRSEANGVFLACDKMSISNLELAKKIVDIDQGIRIKYQGTDTSQSFVYDNVMSRQVLHIECQVSIEQGLKEMYEQKV